MKHLDLDTLNAKFIPGTESIAFQDGSFLRDTVTLVRQVRDGYLNYAGFANAFAKVTEKHTCIWVTLTFEDDYYNAHIFPAWLSSANALVSPEYRQYEQFLKLGFNAKDKPLVAFINDKTSKVGGFLKDVENKMAICKTYFTNSDFSDEAVASVLIHEVGHAYTFFQYSIRAVVFNAALAQASQNLSKARTYEEVKIVFNDTCDLLEIGDRSFIEETKNNENRVNQFTYLATNAAKYFSMLPSLDVSKGYSQDAAEELADIFAARHGCERATMEKRTYYELRENNSYLMKTAALSFAKIIAFAASTIVMSVLYVPIAVLDALLTIIYCKNFFSFMRRVSSRNGITTAHQIIRKMQNQLIERLKAAKIKDQALVTMIEESMAYGDQLLSKVSKKDSTLFTIIGFFNSNIRDARGLRAYQDDLESLTANRLFLAASKFTA